MLIISGPSGVGKTTITHEVERRLGGRFSVSMTTRPQTADDTEGEDYYFVDAAEFRRAREAGELLEWAKVFENHYGTPRGPVEEALARGELMILEIDVVGAGEVKRNMPDAETIFVLPPSEATLLERLRTRRREDEATIQRRFSRAKDEISLARSSGTYRHFVVNDELERAVEEAVSIVRAAMAARAGCCEEAEPRG